MADGTIIAAQATTGTGTITQTGMITGVGEMTATMIGVDNGTAAGVTTYTGTQMLTPADLVNVAAGSVLGVVPKEKLPTYNVFYEMRTFSRGTPGLALAKALDGTNVPLGDHVFTFDFGTIGVEVCEDIWSPDGPMRRRCYSGAEVIVNVSASPYRTGVVATRRAASPPPR